MKCDRRDAESADERQPDKGESNFILLGVPRRCRRLGGRIVRAGLLLAIGLSIAAPAYAADKARWTLTTGDLQRQSIQWSSIDLKSVALAGDGSQTPHDWAWADVVSLERSSPVPAIDPGITLVLTTGSRLVGVPTALGETSLQWREQKLGSITVPLPQVRSIDRGVQPASAAAVTDRVQFTNGDAVTGVITDIAVDSISIRTGAGVSTVPLATVQRVTFATVGDAGSTVKKAEGVTVRLAVDDGSKVDATGVRSDGTTVTFQPVGAKAPTSLPIESVLAFEHVDGPALWLASAIPVSQSTAAYFPFAVRQPARFGVSAESDSGSGHDIDVHDRSAVQFTIEPGWQRLHSQFSLRLGAGDAAGWSDATVRVRLDDRVAFEKLHVRADAPGGVIDLPLGAAKTVTLETDFGSSNGTAVEVRWIEPALLRAKASVEMAVPRGKGMEAPGH